MIRVVRNKQVLAMLLGIVFILGAFGSAGAVARGMGGGLIDGKGAAIGTITGAGTRYLVERRRNHRHRHYSRRHRHDYRHR